MQRLYLGAKVVSGVVWYLNNELFAFPPAATLPHAPGMVLSPTSPRQRILPFVNKSGETIPPFAAIKLRLARAGETAEHHGYKPDQDDDPFVVFNGPTEVAADQSSSCTADYPLWAMYNPVDGTPANGESLGTRAGYWQLHRGYEGFLVWGGADGEKVYVQSDVTCRESGGDQYYYSGGKKPNPRYLAVCFPCSPAISLPSVIHANHEGTISHDGGVTLKRWNGGWYNPVPWLPTWLSETSGLTSSGWYSELIEDQVCPVSQNFDFLDSGGNPYNIEADYIDTYYTQYTLIGCTLYWTQLYNRVGSFTRTSLSVPPLEPPVTIDLSDDGIEVEAVVHRMQGEPCTTTCTPFSSIFSLSYGPFPPPDGGKIQYSCPLVEDVWPTFITPTTYFPETVGTCVSAVASGNKVTFVEPSPSDPDLEYWEPPPYKDLPGFDMGGFDNGAFQGEDL